jgi:hypothetical protein
MRKIFFSFLSMYRIRIATHKNKNRGRKIREGPGKYFHSYLLETGGGGRAEEGEGDKEKCTFPPPD